MASPPLDLARIKERASFESVLSRYGIRLRGAGLQRYALCPFHQETKPSCGFHLEKKVFHCFGCGAKGTILDFVARMEGVPLMEAAALVAACCGIAVEGCRNPPGPGDATGIVTKAPRPARVGRGADAPASPEANKRLSFTLDLDPTHPYLAERGLDAGLIATFGLGYCSHGLMKGRICIPIHNEHGLLVAYAGRWPGDDIPENQERYKLPRGFRKSLVLFNLHRVAGAERLVIVEGYWSAFRLHAMEIPAVALMGHYLSERQLALLGQASLDHLTILLDGDDAGRRAVPAMMAALANTLILAQFAVLPDGHQPDTVPEPVLRGLLGRS